MCTRSCLFLHLFLLFLLGYTGCSKQKAPEGFIAPHNTPRQMLFDDGWRFVRGNPPGAHMPDYPDSSWREVTLPHDWSIEDFGFYPQLPVVTPDRWQWRFSEGDSVEWKLPSYNDSRWEPITLPHTWSSRMEGQEGGTYGWYRTTVTLPDSLIAKSLQLHLGRFADADELYWNGTLVGSTGLMPARFQKPFAAPLEPRCYTIPDSLCRPENQVAIRIYTLSGSGGYTEPTLPSVTATGPFTTWSQGGADTGHTFGGTGWYRKRFTLQPSDTTRQISLLFDGIYMFSDIWVNGRRVAVHPNGYTPLHVDITEALLPPGTENVVAVQVKNWGKNSRWYSGSGIYRHVHLLRLPRLHIPLWGIDITTPQVQQEQAVVQVNSQVVSRMQEGGKALLTVALLDAKGLRVAEASDSVLFDPISQSESKIRFTLADPQLWEPGSPQLYTALLTLRHEGRIIDETTQTFGIRSLAVSPESGLTINGKPILLKGGCIHHDNGILGSAAFDRAEYRKLELLMAQGYNAIRTAHNPPSSALLDAADRLGMLVIDEAFDMWREAKRENDYHLFFDNFVRRDLANMVLRDRNHPSVIMWSIGNEIPERADEEGLKIAEMLIKELRTYDITRPVTQGICDFWDRPGLSWEATAPAFALLDVQGYNYQWRRYRTDHDAYPQRIMMGTESFPLEAAQNWAMVERYPYVIGDFVWTAIDYLGESGIAHADTGRNAGHGLRPWPWFNSWCGDIDLIGQKKPQSYFRDLVWGRRSLLAMVHAPSTGQPEKVSPWGWPNEHLSWEWPGFEGSPLTVNCYTSWPTIRLELNGKQVASTEVGIDTPNKASLSIPYQPGQLRVIALTETGADADTFTLTTPGFPASLTLTPDRNPITPKHGDLCFITLQLTDSLGQPITASDRLVTLELTGPAVLQALGNANPQQMQRFTPQNNAQPSSQPFTAQCHTYRGTALIIVRPLGQPGKVTLTASAPNLPSTNLPIKINL